MVETSKRSTIGRGSWLSVSSNGSWWLKPVERGLFIRERDAFSILERIVVVETSAYSNPLIVGQVLSVSSNGSWWLKPAGRQTLMPPPLSFSILERIVVVETLNYEDLVQRPRPFSILERIVVVETGCAVWDRWLAAVLSVSSNGSWWLKRRPTSSHHVPWPLSVSSNGSWWLKPRPGEAALLVATLFQYPRTDRGG